MSAMAPGSRNRPPTRRWFTEPATAASSSLPRPSVDQMGVSVGPGETMFRRMPRGAISTASVRICAFRAVFEAM
ncbi:hypothetical protein D3C81_2050150 [compost metagenome]